MQPFRIYRRIEKGEFFVVGGDCSQGGIDSNVSSFLSKTKLDIPIVYKKRGVAAEMTSDLQPALEWIFDITGVAPVVAFERNNGGGSEMHRLRVLNRLKKYRIYVMKKDGTIEGVETTDRLGYETNTATRPILLGDWKQAYDNKLVRIYDKEMNEQHQAFIVNKQGKPEAAKSRHDDMVISPAVAFQLYQTERPIEINRPAATPPASSIFGYLQRKEEERALRGEFVGY